MKKMIITIGRQFGSGGSEIGRKLGESLGIKCYDKEILYEAAKESGLCDEVAQQYDEIGQQSLMYSLATLWHYGGVGSYQSINEKLYSAQFQLIRTFAAKDESCIFIGRCADYVLEEEPDVYKIYIMADFEDRVERIKEERGIEEAEAKKLIQKRDKQRASYYNFNTSKKWSDVSSYDLCINVSKCGIDGAVELIKDFIHQ